MTFFFGSGGLSKIRMRKKYELQVYSGEHRKGA